MDESATPHDTATTIPKSEGDTFGEVRAGDEEDRSPEKQAKGWRFWAVFPALCITALLAAVESTVVSTALPYIVHELKAGEMYVWFVNAYFLSR